MEATEDTMMAEAEAVRGRMEKILSNHEFKRPFTPPPPSRPTRDMGPKKVVLEKRDSSKSSFEERFYAWKRVALSRALSMDAAEALDMNKRQDLTMFEDTSVLRRHSMDARVR